MNMRIEGCDRSLNCFIRAEDRAQGACPLAGGFNPFSSEQHDTTDEGLHLCKCCCCACCLRPSHAGSKVITLRHMIKQVSGLSYRLRQPCSTYVAQCANNVVQGLEQLFKQHQAHLKQVQHGRSILEAGTEFHRRQHAPVSLVSTGRNQF